MEKYKFPVALVALMWAIYLVDIVLPVSLNSWGILPRTTTGLIGIPLAPLLHGGFWHLVGNSIPFLILSTILMLDGKKNYINLSVFIMLVGGVMVWLMGRSANHIGSSILIFGFWGYLVSRGLFDRSVKSLALSTLVVILYGGMIFGFMPKNGVSFEGHLFGALAGALFAYVNRKSSIKS